VSRKKKSEVPPSSGTDRTTLESPPPVSAVQTQNPDTLPPTDGGDPHPTEAAMPVAAEAWDEQPTVNMTGDDPGPPARDDAAAVEGELDPRELVEGELAGAELIEGEPAEGPAEGAPFEEEAHEAQASADAAEDLDAGVEQARELSRAHLRGLLESLVFASDKPVKSNELARLASAPVKQVKELLAELKDNYAERGIVLDEVAGGWLFRTSVQYAPFVRELTSERPVRLSRAQVETLAIAAYRQPITRPEIDDIRGVDSGATLKLLLERDLVRILGKKDEPGRPLLYGTTTHFLEFFGLKSLKDLPTLREFTELNDESRRVAEAELGEVLPEAAARPEHGDTIAPPAAEHHDTLPPAAADGHEEPGPPEERDEPT
jgi:segregation and condensation protein B